MFTKMNANQLSQARILSLNFVEIEIEATKHLFLRCNLPINCGFVCFDGTLQLRSKSCRRSEGIFIRS